MNSRHFILSFSIFHESVYTKEKNVKREKKTFVHVFSQFIEVKQKFLNGTTHGIFT